MAHRTGRNRGWNGFLLSIVLALSVGLAGCSEESEPEISTEIGSHVAEAGEAAAGALLRTLVGRLTAALEDGGAAHAVEFCEQEALPLTRMVEAGLEGGLSLKRTSFRYRNPMNAPDSAEELALRFFEDAMLDTGARPTHFLQRISEKEIRFYQPLYLGEVCLQCHGNPEDMDPAVLEKLEEVYPTDLAKGYEAGDFRGVVRVSVPSSEGEF